jgi:hypothetical protein
LSGHVLDEFAGCLYKLAEVPVARKANNGLAKNAS